ncbi:MAG: hypothetical protein IV100_26125 [Myxococcales bacterium]|nr:hypothetical protein [Myxococcales bacterium]
MDSQDSTGGTPMDGDALRQIGAAAARLTEIAERRRRSRQLRWVGILVPILLVVLGIWWLVRSTTHNVVERRDEFATAFQERANDRQLAERIATQAKDAAMRVMPEVERQIEKAQATLSARLPKAIEAAAHTLENDVKRHMTEKLDTTLADVKTRQREVLMKHFGTYLECKPSDSRDVCSEKNAQVQKLLDEVTAAYQDWAVQQLTGTFNAHLKALGDIHQTVATMAKGSEEAGDKAAKSASGGNAPTDMLMIFVEMAGDALGAGEASFGGGGPVVVEEGGGEAFAEEGVITHPPLGAPPAPAAPEGQPAPAAPEGQPAPAAPEGQPTAPAKPGPQGP